MGIRLSSLPPELRRQILARAGVAPEPRKRSPSLPKLHLERVCVCGFEMFRPDGAYPDTCDGCGSPWPGDRA